MVFKKSESTALSRTPQWLQVSIPEGKKKLWERGSNAVKVCIFTTLKSSDSLKAIRDSCAG